MDDLQTVRDLLWVVNSTSLIDGAQVADSTVLDADQIDPVELSTFLSEIATTASGATSNDWFFSGSNGFAEFAS